MFFMKFQQLKQTEYKKEIRNVIKTLPWKVQIQIINLFLRCILQVKIVNSTHKGLFLSYENVILNDIITHINVEPYFLKQPWKNNKKKICKI